MCSWYRRPSFPIGNRRSAIRQNVMRATKFPCRAGMGAKFKSAPKPDAVVPFGFLTYVVVVALFRFNIVGVPPTVGIEAAREGSRLVVQGTNRREPRGPLDVMAVSRLDSAVYPQYLWPPGLVGLRSKTSLDKWALKEQKADARAVAPDLTERCRSQKRLRYEILSNGVPRFVSSNGIRAARALCTSSNSIPTPALSR